MLREALAAGRLIPAVPSHVPLIDGAAPESRDSLLATAGQTCVFHDRSASRCRIHAALGHHALPLACRQFPRVTVLDPTSTSVTLSHYCPTAAALIDAEGPIAIIERPTAFPPTAEYVGLDARESLPPLLRPDMAMAWTDWRAFEARAVAVLGRSDLEASTALSHIAAVIERLRAWRPAEGPLRPTIDDAFSDATGRSTPDTPAAEQLIAAVLEAIPHDIRPTTLTTHTYTRAPAHRRFVIAHAFASWTAHLGLGLRSWLRGLHAADALVRAGLGVGQADLLLRHLADPYELAGRWSEAED